jgi:hypothetical protein
MDEVALDAVVRGSRSDVVAVRARSGSPAEGAGLAREVDVTSAHEELTRRAHTHERAMSRASFST